MEPAFINANPPLGSSHRVTVQLLRKRRVFSLSNPRMLSFPPKPKAQQSSSPTLSLSLSLMAACDFSSEDEIEDENPSISQMFSTLRDSFRMEEFDRVEEAIVATVAKLKHQNKILKINAGFERLDRLKVADELKALKEKEVVCEDKQVISALRLKIATLEMEKLELDREYEALLSRILQLEDDTMKLFSEIFMGSSTIEGRSLSGGVREDDRNDRRVINLVNVLDSLIGPHADGNLQTSVSEAKLKLEIENQRIQYATLEKKLNFELQEKLKVEDELKECKAELQGLKENPNVANENCEKLLEEVSKGRKDENEAFVFDSQMKNNELENNSTCAELLDSEIKRLNKYFEKKRLNMLINSNLLGSRNMEERNKHRGMSDDGRTKKCSVSSDHVINVEDLCDSVPASASSRGSGFHGSGTPKFSPGNAILISDSDDDCAPGEKKLKVLKRKRASSPNTSDNDDGGDNLERDIIPTAEMKQHWKLSRCGSLVNHFSETVGSSAKVSNESDDSSTSISSSDDSEDEDEYLSLFKDVDKKAKA